VLTFENHLTNQQSSMPRGPRLDSPGTLHHVIIRGIEKREIVTDDKDRDNFVSRMGAVALKTGTGIYAWALMTNHAHILLKSGQQGLSAFMSKFLTGYSIVYNRLQNRYKSIVCEEEPYFLKLVSYIHLNPLRARIVKSFEELGRYPWCGHVVLMGMKPYDWQDSDYVMGYFGKRVGEARKVYLEFMAQEFTLGQQPELTGGGLIRSAGGWSEVLSMRRRGDRQFSDERILGSGEFAQEMIDEADAMVKEKMPLAGRLSDVSEIVERSCENHGVTRQSLEGGCRRKECSKVRKELAMKLVLELGLTYAEMAPLLGISASAVSKIINITAVG
jgi:REP element-mobilizing transposase RayT